MNKGAIEEPLQAHSIVETYQEGLRLFMGQGELNQTLVRLVRNLEQDGIDYMVVGAIALKRTGTGDSLRTSTS